MEKFVSLLIISIAVVLSGCNLTPPTKYFDVAILNTNLLADFAGDGLLRQLESPSSKLSQSGAVIPMSRAEVIETKIMFIEQNFEKVKDLGVTDETKDLLNATLLLYEFVLPVYNKEYKELARLYDENAPREQIQMNAQLIQDKYASRFGELHSRLMSLGKPFAEKHNIKVNWDVSTSPSF